MTNRFLTRPLSHSQLSAWEYDPTEWYKRYILGERFEPNATMIAGTKIGDAIGTGACPLLKAKSKEHYIYPSGVKEFKLTAKLGDIYLVGYCDHFDPTTHTLHENKTSTNRYRWNQRKTDEHDQFTMYALMLFLCHNIPPEDVTMYLNFIPTCKLLVPKADFKDVPEWALDEHICDERVELPDVIEWKQYPTKRTTEDLERYVTYVENTVKAMQEYVDNFAESQG